MALVPIDEAFEMYRRGHKLKDIAEKFGLSEAAIKQRSCKHKWKQRKKDLAGLNDGIIVDPASERPPEPTAEHGQDRSEEEQQDASVGVRESAFRMFIAGSTLATISDQLGVGKRKVSEWYIEDAWCEKREVFKRRAQETLYFRLIGQIEQSCQQYLAGAIVLGRMAYEALHKIYEENKFNRTYEDKAAVIQKFSIMLERGSRIHKNVVPTADEKLGEKMLKELQDLNSERSLVVIEQKKEGKYPTDG